MLKKLTIILVLFMFLFSAMPAYAANNHPWDVKAPIIYKSDLVVSEAGGVYQVGFTTIKIPEHFISQDKLPVVLHVEISSVDGVPGIEFTPDIPYFNGNVTIIVHSYNGLLYNETSGTNDRERIKQQILRVHHFSRYAFS